MSHVEPALNNDPSIDFAPVDAIHAGLRRWWLVTLLTFLGGLAGWLVSLAQPPLYEARASLLTTIDFSSTGALTQFEEDLMMDAVGSVFRANDVVDRVLERAGQQGLIISPEEFKESGFLERRLGTWEVRVRSRSPEAAAQLANLWLEEGGLALQGAFSHAVQAGAIARYSQALEGCLESTAADSAALSCNGASLAEIQAEMRRAAADMAQERLASRGLIAGILLGPPQLADIPARPVHGWRGSLVLAGALIGFLIGLLAAQSGLWSQKRG